jgi:hypothetical protein
MTVGSTMVIGATMMESSEFDDGIVDRPARGEPIGFCPPILPQKGSAGSPNQRLLTFRNDLLLPVLRMFGTSLPAPLKSLLVPLASSPWLDS